MLSANANCEVDPVRYEQKIIIRANNQEEQLKYRAKQHIDELEPEQGREFEVIIRLYQSNKTTEQLGYYWGVVVKYFMNWSGHTKNECDQILKEECAEPHKFTFDGSDYIARKSIAKMGIREMSEYIDQCIIYLASQGCIVPHPHYKGVA